MANSKNTVGRRYLLGIIASGAATVAGCSGGGDGEDPTATPTHDPNTPTGTATSTPNDSNTPTPTETTPTEVEPTPTDTATSTETSTETPPPQTPTPSGPDYSLEGNAARRRRGWELLPYNPDENDDPGVTWIQDWNLWNEIPVISGEAMNRDLSLRNIEFVNHEDVDTRSFIIANSPYHNDFRSFFQLGSDAAVDSGSLRDVEELDLIEEYNGVPIFGFIDQYDREVKVLYHPPSNVLNTTFTPAVEAAEDIVDFLDGNSDVPSMHDEIGWPHSGEFGDHLFLMTGYEEGVPGGFKDDTAAGDDFVITYRVNPDSWEVREEVRTAGKDWGIKEYGFYRDPSFLDELYE